MSEEKRISPLLDGFEIGNPISDHHGVRCCPAIKENTDKKYIIKVVSIPATQVQMDALLLAGAYKDPADAMEYFRQIGEDIMGEAALLKKLSKLDGFLPYEGWQMEPITRRRLGYEVYLVGSYKRSLEKHIRTHPVTHLEAMNLGMDLCSALTVCRDSGALYVDLKPSNIFVSDKKEYRIGDLGFIPLDALSYTALPEKYHSSYTAPELLDPMAPLNLTADTYAVGMILYQLYNDGQLPFKGLRNPEKEIPSPLNADYELAEILMKAIHPDPTQRWTDPKDLGKAMATYMQKNAVNDTPITPHTPLDVKPGSIISISKKKKPKAQKAEDLNMENTSGISETDKPTQEVIEEASAKLEESIDNSDIAEICEDDFIQEETLSEASEDILKDVEEIPLDASIANDPDSEVLEEVHSDTEPEEILVEDEPESASVDSQEDETIELSEELSEIIEKADDLIAHDIPQDIQIEEEEAEDPFAFAAEDTEDFDDSDIPEEPLMDESPETAPSVSKTKKSKKKFADPKYKRRTKRFFTFLLCMMILLCAGFMGFWYYQNIYLISIDDISIEGTQEQITVTVEHQHPDAPLVVRCIDPYGKTDTRGLAGNQTTFSGLQPNTMYKIQLEADGFHKLTGETSDVFTTEATTRIISFTSVAGAEDGSVMLSFTVDGEEPNDWTVYYKTDGEEEKRKTFTGHTVSISGLTVGNVYTFRLDPGENMAVSGETTLELMASRLILAENLVIHSENGTDISVHWKAPGDIVVESWEVRCYDNVEYDETITVSDTQAQFSGLNPASSYTVEVTAFGMTQPARTGITANPISIGSILVDNQDYSELSVSWDFVGNEPEDGWLLLYNLVGGQKNVVKSDKASAVIPLQIPGAKYEISVQAANGTTVFNNVLTYECPKAEPFDKHNLKAEQIRFNLLNTPEDRWKFEEIDPASLKDTFTPGEKISIGMRGSDSFYLTGVDVEILLVIRDSYGNILPDLITEDTVSWKNLWARGDVHVGELDLSAAPAASGSYVLSVYFDGMIAGEIPFTITQ